MIVQEMMTTRRVLSVAPEVRAALIDGSGPLLQAWALVVAFERGDWAGVGEAVAGLKLAEADVAALYRESLAWAEEVSSPCHR